MHYQSLDAKQNPTKFENVKKSHLASETQSELPPSMRPKWREPRGEAAAANTSLQLGRRLSRAPHAAEETRTSSGNANSARAQRARLKLRGAAGASLMFDCFLLDPSTPGPLLLGLSPPPPGKFVRVAESMALDRGVPSALRCWDFR